MQGEPVENLVPVADGVPGIDQFLALGGNALEFLGILEQPLEFIEHVIFVGVDAIDHVFEARRLEAGRLLGQQAGVAGGYLEVLANDFLGDRAARGGDEGRIDQPRVPLALQKTGRRRLLFFQHQPKCGLCNDGKCPETIRSIRLRHG